MEPISKWLVGSSVKGQQLTICWGELGASGLTEKEDMWVFHGQLGKHNTT